jgi:hypothetical protein
VAGSTLILQVVSAGASSGTLALAVAVAIAYRRDRAEARQLRAQLAEELAAVEAWSDAARARDEEIYGQGRWRGADPRGCP